MTNQNDVIEILNRTIECFCQDFIHEPYLCYTEHGHHALFYSQLLDALSPEQRFVFWRGRKVCVVQKEYPTAGPLGKPRRQHWDIALIKNPPESFHTGLCSYDYLRLTAIVEFALNGTAEHLKDDISRLCHDQANTDNRLIVHLYRLSDARTRISGRDWSPDSSVLYPKEKVCDLVAMLPICIYYGVVDPTGTNESGVWRIKGGKIDKIDGLGDR
jgi:hypothetical protein